MAWFNPTEHNPISGPSQLPAGKYRVRVLKTGRRANKDNNASMLAIDCGILDGPNAGQTGTFNLNIWNSNEVASRIAAGHLAAITQVTGTWQAGLSAMPEGVELWGKDFMVEMVPQTDSKYTQIGNIFDVQGKPPVEWAKLGAAAPNAGAPPQQAGQPPAPAYAPPAQGGFPAPQGWGGFPDPGAGPAFGQPPQGAPAFGQPQQQPGFPGQPGAPPAFGQAAPAAPFQQGAMPPQPGWAQR